MNFIKKLLFWTTFWTGILLILVLLISLLLPHIISPEYLKTKIVEQVSLRIGYKIKIQQVDIILFPRFHADIKNTTVSAPGNFSVNINSIKAYPKIWPLLAGTVNIYKLYLDSPEIKINIPERLSEEIELLKGSVIQNIEKELHDFFIRRTIEKTDIDVQVRNGTVTLDNGANLYFSFRNISSKFKINPKRIKVAINAKSNSCDNISANGQYFPDNSNGKGDVSFYNFNPKLIFDYFYPDSQLKVSDSRTDIKVTFSKNGVLNLNSKFEGKIPLLSLKKNNKNLILKNGYLSGSMNISGDDSKVNLEKLVLDGPGSIISGNYVAGTKNSPVQLDLMGKNLDIDKTGRIILFLTDNSETFNAIFTILKDGKVSSLNIKSKAFQASELGNIKNISIKGSLLNAKVSVPEPSLELENLKGDVMVSGGILEARNVECRLGNSLGKNGTFKLGLPEDNDLFYLDAFVDADLSQLPPILKKVIENKTFLKELSLIEQCKGKAEGKLTIDERSGSSYTKVDVSRFDLKGIYGRFSNPIAVIGNKFFYDNSVLKFMVSNATSGKTSASNLSAEFKFDKNYPFKILTGKTVIDSSEINQFILPYTQNSTKQLIINRGTLNLNNIELNGPLFNPVKWILKTDGRIENMLVDCKSLFKEAINITNLKFIANQNKGFFYLKVMDAAIRKSFIPNLSAEFRLEKDYEFKIRSEKITIDAKELNLFTPYFSVTKTAAEKINIHKGTASFYNFNLKGPLFICDKWLFSTAGKMENMLIDYKPVIKEPFNITTLNFSTSQNFSKKGFVQIKYNIEYGYISSGKSNVTINGDISLSKEESRLDISAFSESLYWSDIKDLVNQPDSKSSMKSEKPKTSSIKGIIRAHIDNFIYDDYTLSPFQADITFAANKTNIAILQAGLCGISLAGTLDALPSNMEFKINSFAKDQNLEPSLKCFWKGKHLATGIFNLESNIHSKGEEREVSKLLYGTFEFNANKGRIYRLGFLSKIFALLNVTEIFRGKLPDLVGEGFAYNTITIEGKVEKGDFIVNKFVIDGASMAIACTGDIDISNNKADLVVLISPFKTIDLIVKYIPVLSQVLGGNIISIPFRVLGKIDDPDVIPLSPTAVGSSLLNILQRTITLPVKIIQPITSSKDMVNEAKLTNGQ